MTPASGVGGALTRYRVMAFVTGSFLLVLTTTTVLKYLVGLENETFLETHSVIGIVHGWIFMIYAFTCADLWWRMKWGPVRLLLMVAGGVVPVMSFVVERRVSRDVAASLDA